MSYPDISGDLYSTPTEVENIPPSWALNFTATSAIIIAILGFLGNVLTMFALPSSPRLRNASTWFVVNLAASECLFCLTILPMSAAHLIYLDRKEIPLFSEDGCRAFVFLRYVNIQAELLSIAGVALNRCILIVMPHRYNNIFTLRHTLLLIISIWTSSILVMMLPLFEIYGRFTYNPITHECDFADDTLSGQGPRRMYLALGFLTPAFIIIASYIFIFYKARSSIHKVRTMQQQRQRRAESISSCNSNDTHSKPAIGLRSRDIRIAVTILVIFIVFLICCAPVSVMHYYDDTGKYTTCLLLVHPLYWLQYCLNIFIYVFMNKQYRDAYVNYISGWWPSFKNFTMDNLKWAEEEPTSDRDKDGKVATPRLHKVALSNSYAKKNQENQQQKENCV